MSEVRKYKALGDMTPRSRVGGGEWVRLEDFDAAQAELSALREELSASFANQRALDEEASNLLIRLTDAEQRNATLNKAIQPFVSYAENAGIPSELGVLCSKGRFEITREDWRALVALNPTESGASE